MARVLPLILVVSILQHAPAPKRQLAANEAALLVENVPEVRRAKAGYRRPKVVLLGEIGDSFLFQARSTMARGAASGLIDNYQVNRYTGRILRGMEQNRGEADSFLLRDLRLHLLGRSPQTTHPRKVLDVRAKELLDGIRESSGPPAYSLWGIVVGKLFPKNRAELAKDLHVDVLNPDPKIGLSLSGYSVWQESDVPPIVEVYLGPGEKVAEIYVEVVTDRVSLEWLFGEEFTNSISTIDIARWEKLIESNRVAESGQVIKGVDSLFLDFPGKGVCACVYRRPSSIDPIFVSFYSPDVTPAGETLPDSLLRRMVSCLGNPEVAR